MLFKKKSLDKDHEPYNNKSFPLISRTKQMTKGEQDLTNTTVDSFLILGTSASK